LRFSSGAKYDNLLLFGGVPGCERKAAFFLPYYMDKDAFEPDDYITAIKAVTKFALPGHRDFLGAILALGIRREFLGDIFVSGDTAYFFCLPTVAKHILLSLDRIGKYGVSVQEVPLSAVPAPVRETQDVSFTVKSMRLDAVAAGMFGQSRTAMADSIEQGAVTLNYRECLKTDTGVNEGDTISVRGRGKGQIKNCGGVSRKGRLFVTAEIFK